MLRPFQVFAEVAARIAGLADEANFILVEIRKARPAPSLTGVELGSAERPAGSAAALRAITELSPLTAARGRNIIA